LEQAEKELDQDSERQSVKSRIRESMNKAASLGDRFGASADTLPAEKSGLQKMDVDSSSSASSSSSAFSSSSSTSSPSSTSSSSSTSQSDSVSSFLYGARAKSRVDAQKQKDAEQEKAAEAQRQQDAEKMKALVQSAQTINSQPLLQRSSPFPQMPPPTGPRMSLDEITSTLNMLNAKALKAKLKKDMKQHDEIQKEIAELTKQKLASAVPAPSAMPIPPPPTYKPVEVLTGMDSRGRMMSLSKAPTPEESKLPKASFKRKRKPEDKLNKEGRKGYFQADVEDQSLRQLVEQERLTNNQYDDNIANSIMTNTSYKVFFLFRCFVFLVFP
jgi:hypothetical protein